MCGIYGSTTIYSEEIIQAKLDRVNFRGPDYSGFVNYSNRVIFGHNRLAIIDLEARSNQPFTFHHLSIVFNGEIYNYSELKQELTSLGHSFKTTSDTEVICASYLEWGEACTSRFNGMFALVIFDANEGILFGSRDRLGKKPFYYLLDGGEFEFASQPSQIALGNNLSVNERAISQFLVWHHIPDPDTIYTSIKKLPAGHSFTFNLRSKEFHCEKYWDIDIKQTCDLSYDEARSQLKDLLLDAIKKRMIADVPLGVFLSGGVDSSLVAALAQSNSELPLKTFSVKFNEEKFDESYYAEKVANHLRTQHTTILCDYKEGISLIEDFCNYYDEPFGDGSAIPTMLLAKHTRKYVTVALSGDGGDEGFLGYTRYQWIRKFEQIVNVPQSLKDAVSFLFKNVPNKRVNSIGYVVNLPSIADIYKAINSSTNTRHLIDPYQSESGYYERWLHTEKDLLERVSDYDLKTYLNSDINTKVDRATMAFSLESRAPLMDHRVIEFSRMLPTHYKLYKGRKKRILKDILRDYIPNDLIERPKMGFGMPLSLWFRNELKDYVYDNLTESNLSSIPNLNVKYVRSAIDLHMANKLDANILIWDLLVLTQWMKSRKNK